MVTKKMHKKLERKTDEELFRYIAWLDANLSTVGSPITAMTWEEKRRLCMGLLYDRDAWPKNVAGFDEWGLRE